MGDSTYQFPVLSTNYREVRNGFLQGFLPPCHQWHQGENKCDGHCSSEGSQPHLKGAGGKELLYCTILASAYIIEYFNNNENWFLSSCFYMWFFVCWKKLETHAVFLFYSEDVLCILAAKSMTVPCEPCWFVLHLLNANGKQIIQLFTVILVQFTQTRKSKTSSIIYGDYVNTGPPSE